MTLETRPLGRGGLQVPTVGLGTWRVLDVRGAQVEAERHAVVHRALDAGCTVVDTSPMYGEAERVLADALRGRREQAFVATKLWTPSHREARRQLARTLRWYGDRVDLYQVHNLVAWPERLALLEAERDAGRVRTLGVTHYDPAAFDEIEAIVRSGRVDAIQVPLNPWQRQAEDRLLPVAADHGVGVVVMRPLGEGDLVRRSPPARALAPLREFGVHTWAQALLKWALSDLRTTVVIPATSRPERAAENARAGVGPWFEPEQRALVERLAADLAGG